MNLILEKFPRFGKLWHEHLEWWEGEEAGLCNDISVFSDYAISLLKLNLSKNNDEVKQIFELIEDLMNNGDEEVKNAAATCFLENLINAVSWGRVPALSFVHLLGEESKKYCKAWDEFTGVKTEGLWDGK